MAQLPRGGTEARPGTPVDITVVEGTVNDPPTITSEPDLEVTAGDEYAYEPEATDPDENDVLEFSLVTAPDGMTIVAGVISWQTDDEDEGPHDVVVQVSDGRGGVDHQSFTVEVVLPNRPPEALDDAYRTSVDEQLVVGTPGVAGNDSDADGDELTVSVVEPPTNGAVDLDSDGSFTYTPDVAGDGAETYDDIDLATVSSPVVTASSEHQDRGTDRAFDTYDGTSWLTTATDHAAFLQLDFPRDVTVDELRYLGNSEPSIGYLGVSGIGTFTGGVFTLYDANDTLLWSSGPVVLPPAPAPFVLDPGAPVVGARRLRFEATGYSAPSGPNGLAELGVLGDGPSIGLHPVGYLRWLFMSARYFALCGNG